MKESYHHTRGGDCVRVRNHDDGCTQRTVKEIKTGQIKSDRTTRGTGHRDW